MDELTKKVADRFVVASLPDFWMNLADVADFCPSCAQKMASLKIRKIKASVFFGADTVKMATDKVASTKMADKWKNLPKGWTEESLKKFWDSMTGDVKHKVTKCIKQMEGKVDDPGAFCASVMDRLEGKEWRKEAQTASTVTERYLEKVAADPLAVLKSLKEGDKVKVEANRLSKPRVLSVYTGSGAVRPGHKGGGLLTYQPKSYGNDVMYQATPLQQITEVTKLTKV